MIGIVLFIVLAVYLQATSRFHFFYVEQLQLFQFSGDYLSERLCRPGGLALLTGEFLTQFYATPYVGAVVTAGLLTTAGLLMRSLLRQLNPSRELPLLYLLPSLGLLLAQYDFNYLTQGTVAYLLALASLRGWAGLGERRRLGVALLIVPLLFAAAGSVAMLFAFCTLLFELLCTPRRVFPAILIPAEAVLLAVGSVWGLAVTDYRFAFLPDGYYHPILRAPVSVYLAWIALPFGLVGARYWWRSPVASRKRAIGEGIVQLALFGAIAGWSVPRYDDHNAYPLKELDYYARTEQWERIVRRCEGPLNNYLYLNYLNRALAERGELADRMFTFDQRGTMGLLIPWNKTFSVSTLLSDIYFTLGEVALAQEMAFEGYTTVIGAGNPRNLQRLIQTNLIFGAYPVAEKYISILERTYAYRDWAKRHRAFLYDDKAVEADPLLGMKRTGLPRESDLAGIRGLDKDLLARAEAHPGQPLPIQFVGSLYLLTKDMQAFQVLVDRYYGTPALPTLPVAFQEAVLLLNEKTPDKWKQYAISDATKVRFAAFRKMVAQYRGDSRLPFLLRQSFGESYWSYFIFKRIQTKR